MFFDLPTFTATLTSVNELCQTAMHTSFKNVTVKESCNRLGVAQRVPAGLGSQIFMAFGT